MSKITKLSHVKINMTLCSDTFRQAYARVICKIYMINYHETFGDILWSITIFRIKSHFSINNYWLTEELGVLSGGAKRFSGSQILGGSTVRSSMNSSIPSNKSSCPSAPYAISANIYNKWYVYIGLFYNIHIYHTF